MKIVYNKKQHKERRYKMRLSFIIYIFILSSLALICISVERNASLLYAEHLQKIERQKALLVSGKSYKKTRKEYVPFRTVNLAEQSLQELLLQSPIEFKVNSSDLLENLQLPKIVKMLNHLSEEAVLSISAYTDATGSMQENLLLSQQRADSVKKYFENKINLPLLVAIGYGEAFSSKKSLIKIDLKRIK